MEPPNKVTEATEATEPAEAAEAVAAGGRAPSTEETFFSSLMNVLMPLAGGGAAPSPAQATPRDSSMASRVAHARQQRSLERAAVVRPSAPVGTQGA
jgi:hypothetical protein